LAVYTFFTFLGLLLWHSILWSSATRSWQNRHSCIRSLLGLTPCRCLWNKKGVYSSFYHQMGFKKNQWSNSEQTQALVYAPRLSLGQAWDQYRHMLELFPFVLNRLELHI
jgi:hypothetical protein